MRRNTNTAQARTLATVVVLALTLSGCSTSLGQQPVSVNDPEEIEAARKQLIKRWASGGLPKPKNVLAKAKVLLSHPLESQTDTDLVKLAEQANRAANFVTFLLSEYQDYYQDNYRYEFVQKAVQPAHDSYVDISNRLKGIRNKCYFNLGKRAAERGEELQAFAYFRDAYRLSSFGEAEGDHKGMRYYAEIEMKKLLGINDIETYVYWK